MLTATLLSNIARYSATVDQRPGSFGAPSSPELSWKNLSKSSWLWNGAYELPSMPTSSVVMPWRIFGSWCGCCQDDQPGVGVHVDEAGRDDVAGGVDGAGGLDLGDVAAQDADGLALDGDGAVEAGVAGPVDDHAVGDQQVEHEPPPEETGVRLVLRYEGRQSQEGVRGPRGPGW